MPTHEYVFVEIPLGELCRVLIDHGLTFDQLREMSAIALSAALDQVNSGELKSWADKADEERARVEASRGGRKRR